MRPGAFASVTPWRGETASRQHKSAVTFGDRYRAIPGRHERPSAPRSNGARFDRNEVTTRVALIGVDRHGGVRMKSLSEDFHSGKATHAPTHPIFQ